MNLATDLKIWQDNIEISDLYGGTSVYAKSNCNKSRYLLGRVGNKNILFIGINPNTACHNKYDLTTKKIAKFSILNNFDGWILANIYPQRTLTPAQLPNKPEMNEIKTNVDSILKAINVYDIENICCCWGNAISERLYFFEILAELVSFTKKKRFFRLGDLSKAGNPKHPSRLSYSTPLVSFNVKDYLYNKKL